MRILPVLFNTGMVQAILDGRKTATRRAVKGFIPEDAVWGYTFFTPDNCISCRGTFAGEYGEKFFKLPYHAGDTMYVRETWGDYRECRDGGCGYYLYRADYPDNATAYQCAGITCDLPLWHPSIHMPKEAARIWLGVTEVRVERLQDIDDDGVVAEGLEVGSLFEELWDSTIRKSDRDRCGWDANPWVWVVEFERCGKPEEGKKG